MSEKARSRRQNLVRESIYDSALTLFAKNGFDETTLEEVAQAAGISRRSFFRYFASKDDLLARSVVDYGKVLTEAIAACPPSLTPFQVVQVTVMTGVRHNVAQPNLREIINIASHSTNAQQAYGSRLREVESALASAYSSRLQTASGYTMMPWLLATLTLSVMNTALVSWYSGEQKDLPAAASEVFRVLSDMIVSDSSLKAQKQKP
jgi:AcrR family transcriptional regulator